MKMYKKIVSFVLIMLVIFGQISTMAIEISDLKSSQDKQSYKVSKSKPIFYGTIGINLKVGDTLDLKNPVFRIFAKDFYDGDITQNIQIRENTVNTSVEGNYHIKYVVTNSGGNSTEIDVPVVVDNNGERTIKRELYSGDDIWNMDLISTNRGNYHDRQNLGIYLKAGASIKVRTINKDLEIIGQFLNNDKNTELKFGIKNNWTTIKTQYDSVPFIKTLYKTTEAPVIEISIENLYIKDSLVKPLDYYLYGDNEKEFLSEWGESRNSYAVMEDDRITFLVPYSDKEKIIVEDNSKKPYFFETIESLFNFYKDIFKMYDSFIGLEDHPTDKINQNVKTKYFVKANKNGAGMAYYSKDHTAFNGESIVYYFHKNWMILHELGHGYDDPLTGGNVDLSEAANNILAYYYEQKYLTTGDNGWMGDISKQETHWNNARKSLKGTFNDIKKYSYSSTDQYHVRLYMMINILNKIDPQKGMAAVYKQARNNKNEGLKVSTADLIAKSFATESKFNVIPYLESWKIEISNELKQEIEKQNYPIIYYLRDLVNSDSKAKEIQNGLGLEGMYSLVLNEEIENYNLKGAAKIQLTQEDYEKIKGKDILLKSGNTIFKRAQVNSTVVNIENIPVGVYKIEIASENYAIESQYLIVTQDQINESNIVLNATQNTGYEELVIKDIQITHPTKVKYVVGEELDLTGLKIEVIYSNGTRERIEEGYTVKGYNKEKLGKQTLTISYNGYEKNYQIEVQTQKDYDNTGNNNKLPQTGKFFELQDLLKIVIIVSIISILALVRIQKKS